MEGGPALLSLLAPATCRGPRREKAGPLPSRPGQSIYSQPRGGAAEPAGRRVRGSQAHTPPLVPAPAHNCYPNAYNMRHLAPPAFALSLAEHPAVCWRGQSLDKPGVELMGRR